MENNNLISPSTVDVLVPTKPIQGYKEFNCGLKAVEAGNPDYKFQLSRVDNLVLFKTELIGKEFRIPDCQFTAQIKCGVIYDRFTLFIRFIDPPNEGKHVDLTVNPAITTVIIDDNTYYHSYYNSRSSDEKLRYVFPYNINFVYGIFYPFCTLSFHENLKKVISSDSKSITLHLYVRNVVSLGLAFPEEGFLWQADVSNCKDHRADFENEEQLAMSPMLSVAHSEVKVQLRLFYKDRSFYVEVRYLSAWYAPNSKMVLTVVHTNPYTGSSTERIIKPFELVHSLPTPQPNLYKKSSTILLLAPIEKLFSYKNDNYKLFLSLEMQ